LDYLHLEENLDNLELHRELALETLDKKMFQTISWMNK
jgi:hypothetical protein